MPHLNLKTLIILSCLALSSAVQAQTTSDEVYNKLKSFFNNQRKGNDKRKKPNPPTRNIQNTISAEKTILPVTISQLRKYNVVAVSYELLSNAQQQCRRLVEYGYPAMIYIDSKNFYRVIAGSFDNEQDALSVRQYIIDAFPDSWILCIEKGNEEKYVQKRNPDYNHIYELIEKMPSFPGGDAMLMRFLSENIKYPAIAEENGIQGRVIITFVVEQDGSITNVTVVKSADPSLDAEAVRVITSMPKWIPGKIDGEPVRVKYTVPVTFRLR